jgi:hypothetical protein
MNEWPQWATDIPELGTRPGLVNEALASPRLRRTVLRIVADFMGVATRLAGHDCAAEVLAAMWQRRRQSLHASWNGRLGPTYSELHGFARNVWRNSMHRATGKTQMMGEHDVRRSRPDWLDGQ